MATVQYAERRDVGGECVLLKELVQVPSSVNESARRNYVPCAE